MKVRRKKINILLFIFIGIITLSIGYAGISAVNLIINGNATASANQDNFDVKFIEENNVSPIVNPSNVGTASIVNDTTAVFNISGVLVKGDTVTVTYKIKNNSKGIGTNISVDITNSNQTFFKTKVTLIDRVLQPGDTTIATVTVECKKTPIEENATSQIIANLHAEPIEESTATGEYNNSTKLEEKPFYNDSWSTIKTNIQNGNTYQYDVGDIKTVKIGNKDYTVRIANKSTYDWCDDEEYSQTACGFVVEFAEIVEYKQMNSTTTNVGGWPASDLYTYVQGSFYNSLPSDLKESISTTRVISGHHCTTGYDISINSCIDNDNEIDNYKTYDKLYLLSIKEYLGEDRVDTAANTTKQLDYYVGSVKDGTIVVDLDAGPTTLDTYSRIKKPYKGSSGSRVQDGYWMRTANMANDRAFRKITGGATTSLYASSSYYTGYVPAFRIG